jgi:hypothetical protein
MLIGSDDMHEATVRLIVMPVKVVAAMTMTSMMMVMTRMMAMILMMTTAGQTPNKMLERKVLDTAHLDVPESAGEAGS